MIKNVQLPFFIPEFATYHNTAIVDLAFFNKSHAENQLHNQRTELTCERDFLFGFSSPKITVPDANLFTFPNMDRHCVSMIYAYPFYREIIREMIDTGSYIYLSCIDDYYLPGKSWYMEKHRIHDGIICGYDDTDNTFTLAAYDNNWIFREIRIPQESYKASIDAALEAGNNVRITAVVIRDNVIELDLQGLLNKLKGYIESDIQKYSLEEKGTVRGMAVYDCLDLYFDKLLDASISHEKMDWRIMRILWEYRVGMYKRICAIEDNLKLENERSESYEKIVKETDKLRMLYAFYHQKPKESTLRVIKNGMNRLKEVEKQELALLISKMEEAIKE